MTLQNTEPNRPLNVAVVMAIVVMLISSSFIAMGQQSPCNGTVVMDLTQTSQVWCVPHVYQGDFNGQPVSSWPVYYGPNNASQYWGISSNQPVLEMVPPQTGSAGAMFWQGYYNGGTVTILLVGTFTTGTIGSVADGFEIYLFIKPSGWSISPASNYSVPYLHPGAPSYAVQGGVIFPYAMPNTEYIVVQWDPWWSYGSGIRPPNGGDWNVWVGVGNGNSTPGIVDVIGGVGSGAFEPYPGDLIVVEVTYNPSTNTISGYAYDLSNGASASFSYSLNGYFAPPGPGQYVFGIAGNTGGWYANWGVMAVSEEGITYMPITSHTIPPPSSYFYLRVIAPDYANWTIYANVSNNWYAYYSGSGSTMFGPAYAGQPGTTVTFNVTRLDNCPSPLVTYEPSNTLSLNNGANYETIIINCQPLFNVDFNITEGGGVIILISEPGLGVKQLILGSPINKVVTVPLNTIITIYAWTYVGYTLSGVYVNGTEINYLKNLYGAYVYKIMINSNQVINIDFNENK